MIHQLLVVPAVGGLIEHSRSQVDLDQFALMFLEQVLEDLENTWT